MEFSQDKINDFLEFHTKIVDEVFEKGLEHNDEVLSKITSGKCSSKGDMNLDYQHRC